MRLGIKLTGSPAVVNELHFRPHMARIWEIVLDEAPPMDDGICWCTCGVDSHTTGLHPPGDALDFRCNNIIASSLAERRETQDAWATVVQRRLGDDYDVVSEKHEKQERDHLHVEFDPD